MKLALDISDEFYCRLMLKADEEGMPVHDIMLRGVEKELARESSNTEPFEVPIIPSAKAGSLNLTYEQIENSLSLSE